MVEGGKPKPPAAAGRQYATLPFRVSKAGSLELLLLTSRETRRWVIPKGWPIPGLSAAESAAREAFEEAGLRGTILGEAPIGAYFYDKRLPRGVMSTRVDVFLLQVARQVKKWPEKNERQTRWCMPEEAAGLVQEADLAALMREAPGMIRQIELRMYRELPAAV